MAKTARVALVDFDADVRFGRRLILESNKALKIFFDSNGRTEDIDNIAAALIDTCIIDQRLESGSGIDFYQQLRNRMGIKQVPAAVLTAPLSQPALEVQALAAGFSSVVSLEAGAEQLLEVTLKASEGEPLIDTNKLALLVNEVKPQRFLDIHLNQAVAALPEKYQSNLRRLRTAWNSALSGKNSTYDLKDISAVATRLNFQTPFEAVLKLYLSGNLDGQ